VCLGLGDMPVGLGKMLTFAFAVCHGFNTYPFRRSGTYPGDFGMRDNPVMICVFTIGEIGR
jgi:hypothetical protein